MMSRSLSPSTAYPESLGNYLSTYLCPMASEKPFLQKALQVDRFQSGVHLEELRVFKRAPPITTSMTITYNDNQPQEDKDGAVLSSPYGVPVYERGTLNPGQNGIPYQNERQAATSMAGHELSPASQNVNTSWKKFGKPVSQPTVIWKTGFASQPYVPPAENIILPDTSSQYQLETDYDGVLKVFTKSNGSHFQNGQDGGVHNGEISGNDQQSVSASQYQLYDTGYDSFEPSDYGCEMTWQRKLPNISTFRRFVNTYKSYNISRDGEIDQSDVVTPQQIQTKSYSSQTEDQWSISNKDQFNRDVVTPEKPKIAAPREGTFYRDVTYTAKENSHNTDQSCDNDEASNRRVNAHKSQDKIQDHAQQKHRCSVCWKSFSQTANLKAHVRIHTGERPFVCPVCHRRFSQRSSVKTHMRIHSGERPFSCTFCKKSFYDSSTLIKHRRIHTGEKPYLCKICHQRFSQSGNLTRHYKLHATKKL